MNPTFKHYMNQYMNEELEHEGELWQRMNPIMVGIQDFEQSPRTPYTPKETTMTKDTGHRIIETPKAKEQTMTKEQAPKESSNTVVVITWESWDG